MNKFEKLAVTFTGVATVGAVGANVYIAQTSNEPVSETANLVCIEGGDNAARLISRETGEVFAETNSQPVEIKSVLPWKEDYSYADAKWADGASESNAFNIYRNKDGSGSCSLSDGEKYPIVSSTSVPMPNVIFTGYKVSGPNGS